MKTWQNLPDLEISFIKLVVVVVMVFNFLITDKSIMAEGSSLPSKVSTCITTSAFSSHILVQKGQEKIRWSEDKSEVSEPNTPFSLLRCNWLEQNVLMSWISTPKSWPTKHIFLNKENSLIQFREIRHYQQNEKERIIQVNIFINDTGKTKRKDYNIFLPNNLLFYWSNSRSNLCSLSHPKGFQFVGTIHIDSSTAPPKTAFNVLFAEPNPS